jgi:ATP synthase H subunit
MVRRDEILFRIKDAERRVKAMIAKAEEEKSKLLAEARGKAMELVERLERELEHWGQRRLQEAEEEIRKELKSLIESGVKRAEDLKARARRNINKSVKMVLEAFERYLHA